LIFSFCCDLPIHPANASSSWLLSCIVQFCVAVFRDLVYLPRVCSLPFPTPCPSYILLILFFFRFCFPLSFFLFFFSCSCFFLSPFFLTRPAFSFALLLSWPVFIPSSFFWYMFPLPSLLFSIPSVVFVCFALLFDRPCLLLHCVFLSRAVPPFSLLLICLPALLILLPLFLSHFFASSPSLASPIFLTRLVFSFSLCFYPVFPSWFFLLSMFPSTTVSLHVRLPVLCPGSSLPCFHVLSFLFFSSVLASPFFLTCPLFCFALLFDPACLTLSVFFLFSSPFFLHSLRPFMFSSHASCHYFPYYNSSSSSSCSPSFSSTSASHAHCALFVVVRG
jgi:hypothetical protein